MSYGGGFTQQHQQATGIPGQFAMPAGAQVLPYAQPNAWAGGAGAGALQFPAGAQTFQQYNAQKQAGAEVEDDPDEQDAQQSIEPSMASEVTSVTHTHGAAAEATLLGLLLSYVPETEQTALPWVPSSSPQHQQQRGSPPSVQVHAPWAGAQLDQSWSQRYVAPPAPQHYIPPSAAQHYMPPPAPQHYIAPPVPPHYAPPRPPMHAAPTVPSAPRTQPASAAHGRPAASTVAPPRSLHHHQRVAHIARGTQLGVQGFPPAGTGNTRTVSGRLPDHPSGSHRLASTLQETGPSAPVQLRFERKFKYILLPWDDASVDE
ncbi:hypothetical protein AURDEDRAFT_178071 [Auricularia subglabra TFB-10046 SS5]|uniref:Uncharacterized protein n=1 Tax=Auricularia subglabra (strain TFB-10046 / SS5) TaxID=717982 RepID=J0L8Y2_AURST|nr:hypothetical protein AURDEDRAFT_178071 [Auricularia subglabra TFB-10046 SS5]